MGKLFETIRQLVAEEKYVIGQHASERLEDAVSWNGRWSPGLRTGP